MSGIVKFFIAADDAAAAGVPRSDPAGGPDSLNYGDFDPVGMLDDWQAAFLARDADELAEGKGPAISGGSRNVPVNGVGVLLAVSPDLTAGLAQAGPARLAEVSARWIRLQSLDGAELDPGLAARLLADIGALAARASARGQRVYCWWY